MAKAQLLHRVHIPLPPPVDDERVQKWLKDIKRELDIFFANIMDLIPDKQLDGRVTKQTLAAGFTIEPAGFVCTVNAAGAVTSDTTTAIKDGRNGQWLLIRNVSSVDITIKNNANTRLGAGDIVLNVRDVLLLCWGGGAWLKVAHSDNN